MNAEERRLAREQAADFRAIDAALLRMGNPMTPPAKVPKAPKAPRAPKAAKVTPPPAPVVEPVVELPPPPAPVVVRPKLGRPPRLGKDDPKRDENPNLATRVGTGAERAAGGRPRPLKIDPESGNPNRAASQGAGAVRPSTTEAHRARSRYMPALADAPPSPERVHVRIVVNPAVGGTIAIEHLLAPLDQFIPVTWDDGQGITSARRGILEVDE